MSLVEEDVEEEEGVAVVLSVGLFRDTVEAPAGRLRGLFVDPGTCTCERARSPRALTGIEAETE